MSATNLARLIDHTLLRPEATGAQIDRHCVEATVHEFKSVCINPAYVRRAAGVVEGSDVLVCSVIGFPLGASAPRVKALEAAEAIEAGCDEIDMVLQVGALRAGDHRLVETEIGDVRRAIGTHCLKVILETSLLSAAEVADACRLAEAAGADYVKTSTGFGRRGASIADVEIMRRSVSPRIGVKASGGITSRQIALDMLSAGATRLGTSNSIAIVTGTAASSTY